MLISILAFLLMAPLDVATLMRGPNLYGYAPRAVRWSGDGGRVYFDWKQADEPFDKEPSVYVVGRDGSGLRRLSEEEARQAPPVNGVESADRKRLVFAEKGDLFLYDRTTDKRRRLTHTTDVESSPRFTADGQRIAFMRGSNLYTMSLGDGTVEQWTNIGGGARSDEEKKGPESQEAMKKDERALLAAVDRRARKREQDEAKKKEDEPRKPWKLAPRQSIADLQLSPDESFVVATVREEPADAKRTVVPNYVTESAYTDTIASRPNVGDAQRKQKLALVNVKTGEVTWIDAGQKTEVMLTSARFSDDGRHLAAQAMSADFKDRWILAVETATGKTRVLFHEHDDAWIDGPGAHGFDWLPDNERIWFRSEGTGWAHVYTVDFASGQTRQLTSGNWEVMQARLTPDRQRFVLVTSEASLYEHQVYTMAFDGGARTRLTTAVGWHDATLSPDGKMMADIHSSSNKPPELYLGRALPGAAMTRVTKSPAPEFEAREWIDTPIVTFRAGDGVEVPAHIYKPANWKKGGPAVIFVHGAGYLQNVHRGWSDYPHEYLFNQLLMERGFLVADIDYRGSAGHGRNWRTAVYRHMGGRDLEDHVDAAHWLVAQYGVDPKKIGLYGGSYGGFITLMAMFTKPGVFAAGAALRPVTDWTHYNHGYTASILNLPQKDQEAYKRSSPIQHAAGLEGALLICHGMVDTNVHFQDTVRLAQKLIELGKQNWDVAFYPVEDHGFVDPASWTDEYRRILRLFESHLK
jgi:dipeptidyl aminopeptidase/acylaminoacyl peptidase